MYFFYSVLMGLAALLTSPYWLIQGIRHKKYLSNLGERLGFSFPSLENLPAEGRGALWLHAVSVGEVLAGLKLAKRLKEQFPERRLVVSTTTITGQALAKERMPFADAVIYFPLDWTFCVKRALTAVRPSLVIILETELWPNFLREASRRNRQDGSQHRVRRLPGRSRRGPGRPQVRDVPVAGRQASHHLARGAGT